MKTLVIQTLCDRHQARGSRMQLEDDDPNNTVHVNVLGSGLHSLDMCGQCRDELIAPVAKLLAEYGRMPSKPVVAPPTPSRGPGRPPGRPSGSASGAKRWTCPLCNSDVGRGGAIAHLYAIHMGGMDVPRTGKTCPECGESFPHPSQTGSHRSRKHRWNALDEAVAAARAYQEQEGRLL